MTGTDAGKSVFVEATPIVAGSDPSCDLVLDDRTVSRRHAELELRGAFLAVRDLHSTNGTYYRDARVTEVLLPLGREVSLGHTTVKFVPEEIAVERAPHASDRLGALVGSDPRMREIFATIVDVARTDITVLLEGETGTGKELVARALHECSPRASSPFVVFDCASQPKDLVESALFGHVRGAFTGAESARKGAFERAHGGTLFLDELGEFALDLQPRLLRVLESKEVQKFGGEGHEIVDVRVVAATNRDLRRAVREGRFREDLYYRLAVVRVTLPPLRERPSDIPRLVRHFLEKVSPELTVDPRSLDALCRHAWPGNVRELRNVIERAFALTRGKTVIDPAAFLSDADGAETITHPEEDAPEEAVGNFKDGKAKVLADFERRYLERLLDTHAGNVSAAAREAGIDRKHLKELLRKHGIAGP